MWKTNDPDTKKILYVQTHGEADPERTATPFFLATAGAAMDNEVCIYFTMNGPQCLAKGNADKIVIPRKGGNGIYVKIRHDGIYQTQYLHMSGIAKGIRPGAGAKR